MAETEFRIGGEQQNAETGEIPAMEISGENPNNAPQEPTTAEPTTVEPVENTPQHPEPTGTPPPQPTVTEPVVTEPVVTEPVTPEPVVTEPVAQEPTTPEPVVEKPQLRPELQRLNNYLEQNEGKGLNDYAILAQDWDKMSDLGVIKNQIKLENSKLDLNDEQLTFLAAKKLGVDLSEGVEELYEGDKLAIQIEANKQRELFKQEIEKYDTVADSAAEPTAEPTPTQADAEMVTLSNGQQMEKAKYEQARTQYTTDVKGEVEKLSKETFKIETGSGDSKQTIEIDYIIEDSDRHDVLNELMDVPTNVLEKHVDAQGNLNINTLTQDVLYSNPQRTKKMMQKAISQAHAKGIEEVLKQETNVNFSTPKAEETVRKDKPFIGRDDLVTAKLHGF